MEKNRLFESAPCQKTIWNSLGSEECICNLRSPCKDPEIGSLWSLPFHPNSVQWISVKETTWQEVLPYDRDGQRFLLTGFTENHRQWISTEHKSGDGGTNKLFLGTKTLLPYLEQATSLRISGMSWHLWQHHKVLTSYLSNCLTHVLMCGHAHLHIL